MKTHIIVHVLPFEIDRFEHQIFELNKNSKFLSPDDKVTIDATLNVNDSLVDWSSSKISKQYFIDRFEKLKTICGWATVLFDVSANNECLGVDDKRRTAIRKYASECDNFIYLDNDMFYPNTTLKYMMDAAKLIPNKYWILSPQSNMLWDPSWNVLVNESYMNVRHSDLHTMDPFEIFTKDYGEIEIVPINTFKFGGGWFNMLSSKLLAYTDIPDALGPYGLDDTFVIDACMIMRGMGIDVQQYVVKNLVVTQNYKHELHRVYLDHITFNMNMKQEFARKSAIYYRDEVTKFAERCKHDIIHNSNQK